jgi:hypothetical protein
MGTTEEHCALSASHSKTVVPRSAALLGSRRAGGGRTGAVGGPHRVIRSASASHQGAQLVSTKSLGAGHTRMTTRMGVPQVGQRAVNGFGGVR